MHWIIETYRILPVVVGVLGIVLTVYGFARRRNYGFLLLALLFVHPIMSEILWRIYVHNFVPTETATGVWTAAVRNVDILAFPSILILFVAAWLFLRPTPSATATGPRTS